MKEKQFVFDRADELRTIGAIETLINGYLEGEEGAGAEQLYLCSNICTGKIKYFSTFKKNAGMIYTNLFIMIDAIVENNVDLYNSAYAEYAKYFDIVFKGGMN